MGQKTGKEVICLECGKEHYRSRWQLKLTARYFCSRHCANEGHKKLLTKHTYERVNCPECGREFQQHWKGPKKFCSAGCVSRHQLKVINSKEPKKKGTKPELAFARLLEEYKIEYKFQFYVPWKKGWKKWYDFYLVDYNTLVEVDGIYWHGKDLKTSQLNEQQWNTRKNDRLKNYLAKKRGYKLIRIWSSEIDSLSYNELLKKL